jgi:hypothetical protein
MQESSHAKRTRALKWKQLLAVSLSLAIVMGAVTLAYANNTYYAALNTKYGTALTTAFNCSVCHTSAPNLNPYGNDYLNAGLDFASIENVDSDGDGYTNKTEINAVTNPGSAASHPVPAPDTTAPTVNSFSLPSTSTTLAVTVVLAATDNVSVTGYMITTTSTAPSASATGWTATAPATYTFATAGTQTLYGWAKDAVGNVSAPKSASVTITLPDKTAPSVTGFSIPSTSTSLTVSITTLTATDNVGVTGYMITTTSMPPSATAAGWSAAKPASYGAPSAGTITFYAWAKDAAGNISAPASASVTITLPDSAAPVVTGFVMPSAATSLTVSVTTFTATDNVGVTGYMLTTTSTAPSASATGWTATAPTSYTFPSAGAKTVYAWAKDAAAHVSVPASASVTITLSDNTTPVVTGFVVPTTSNSLTIPVTTFTATDDVSVTGYMITTTSTPPSASAAGWSATKPASYVVPSAGTVTLYAWAKDGAGNISAAATATVTIALADANAPVVTAFVIPTASSSLTVPITALTATDNVGVTGFLLTETSAVPAVTATGWTATALASYTCASAGTKTLYAWAKDAAGNVSTGASQTVQITASDTIAPVISNFSVRQAYATRTVVISQFVATDNVAVTGYLVTETSTKPAANATGWRSTSPASFTFSSGGSKTIYAWAKDASGNISKPVVRQVVVRSYGSYDREDKRREYSTEIDDD